MSEDNCIHFDKAFRQSFSSSNKSNLARFYKKRSSLLASENCVMQTEAEDRRKNISNCTATNRYVHRPGVTERYYEYTA